MLPQVRLLNDMDEATWRALTVNLGGVTDTELDWRPNPASNPIRWIVGHLAWFEEWAHDAIAGDGRYLSDKGPQSHAGHTFAVVWHRLEAARARYQTRLAALTEGDLARTVSYFRRESVTVLEHLQTHTLHLAGHRFQVRYIRGAYSRTFGKRKADFDPW